MRSVKSLPRQRAMADGIVEPVVVPARVAKSASLKREASNQGYLRLEDADDADDLDDDDDGDDEDDDDDDDSTSTSLRPQSTVSTPSPTTSVQALTIPNSHTPFAGAGLPPLTRTSNAPAPSLSPSVSSTSSLPTVSQLSAFSFSSPTTSPTPFKAVTTTVVSTVLPITPPATWTTPTALAETTAQSSPTLVVGPPPTPPPQPFRSIHHQKGLSETTQHALIAVGSICATIVVMIFIWIFVRKKQGMRLSEAAYLSKQDRYRNIEEAIPPLGRWSAAGGEWDRKAPIVETESVTERTLDGVAGLPRRPSASMTRNNSAASKLRKADGRRPSDANSENWPMPQSKALSAVPSSLTMPNNVRVADGGEVPDDSEETNSTVSSLPAYLKGAKNIPPRPRQLETSRFSWTNSQAPQTPATVITEPAGYTRYSVATSRSSVARFRTVDSWVGNQAGRIDEESIQEYIQRYGPQMPTEPVPDVPKQFQMKSPPKQKQAYQAKHHTNLSDATIFNQHPGTKLVIPRTSTVPSDILDGQVTVRKGRDDQSI